MDNKVLLRSTPHSAYLLPAALHDAVSCAQAINRLAGSRHQSQSTCSRDADAPPNKQTATGSRHAVNHGTSFTSGSRSASRFQPGASLWLSASPAGTTAGPTTLSGWIPSSPGCGPGPPADRPCSLCLARRSPCGPHATSAVHLAFGGLSQPAPRCRQKAYSRSHSPRQAALGRRSPSRPPSGEPFSRNGENRTRVVLVPNQVGGHCPTFRLINHVIGLVQLFHSSPRAITRKPGSPCQGSGLLTSSQCSRAR